MVTQRLHRLRDHEGAGITIRGGDEGVRRSRIGIRLGGHRRVELGGARTDGEGQEESGSRGAVVEASAIGAIPNQATLQLQEDRLRGGPLAAQVPAGVVAVCGAEISVILTARTHGELGGSDPQRMHETEERRRDVAIQNLPALRRVADEPHVGTRFELPATQDRNGDRARQPAIEPARFQEGGQLGLTREGTQLLTGQQLPAHAARPHHRDDGLPQLRDELGRVPLLEAEDAQPNARLEYERGALIEGRSPLQVSARAGSDRKIAGGAGLEEEDFGSDQKIVAEVLGEGGRGGQ